LTFENPIKGKIGCMKSMYFLSHIYVLSVTLIGAELIEELRFSIAWCSKPFFAIVENYREETAPSVHPHQMRCQKILKKI